MSATLEHAQGVIQGKLGSVPDLALILGSGLGVLAEGMEGPQMATADIPDYPPSTVEGHAGLWVNGKMGERALLAIKGRVHPYEGYSDEQIAYPIRLLKKLGVSTLVTTNAVGCIDRRLEPGDLVLLEDQINLMFRNPLRGTHRPEEGPRFPDMSAAFDPELMKIARDTALAEGIPLKTGVMAGVLGPSYETPAEIRMLGRMGADVVGMSTIPEVIMARQLGMRVLSISCVTNFAAGIAATPLNHEEVTETAGRVRKDFTRLLTALLARF